MARLVCTSCFMVQKVEADKFHVLYGCGSLCMLNFSRSVSSEEKKLKDKNSEHTRVLVLLNSGSLLLLILFTSSSLHLLICSM